MIRIPVYLLVSFAILPQTWAQPHIQYDVSWDDAASHYYDVSMKISSIDGPFVDVDMPAWRPGRYIMQNYAKYVVEFAATTMDASPLPFAKTDRDTWRIDTRGNKTVIVSYRNYANVLDAGESYLDANEAYLNPVSVLMNVPGRMQEPVSLTIEQPDGWRVATPLDYDADIMAYTAEDYHELVDSPFLVSPDFEVLSFDVNGATIDIAIQGSWEYNEEQLIDDHRAIVSAQFEIMDNVPFDRYLFMYHVPDEPMGHGVEHKNSTSIVLGPASALTMPGGDEMPTGMYEAFLRVASHELFHSWNVERIRPEALYPTDYSREQYTSQMWIFEGITDYYAEVAMLRAGLKSEEDFLSALASTVRSFDNNPGRKITSIAMSSFDSWTKQGNAPPGTFYSFYTAGKAMGLVLDMEVRGRTGGDKSLDDVFRYLYSEYPSRDRGVPESGFQQALETITGSSFSDFFDRHITGTEDVDWNSHLAYGGMKLKEVEDSDASARLRVFMGGRTIMGLDPRGAAAAAVFEQNDEVVSLGEMAVEDSESLQAALDSFAPGDTVDVAVLRDGSESIVSLVVPEMQTTAAIVVLDSTSREQTAIRDAWLGK